MKTLIWKGLYYNSLEYFQWESANNTHIFRSKIIGSSINDLWFLEYKIITDKRWLINSFEISLELNGKKSTIIGKRAENKWFINDIENPLFTGIEFIDISITPFTNSLPINYLTLEVGESKESEVIYLDILKEEISCLKQKYHRQKKNVYTYENVQSDFKADIVVDENGLVVNYPNIFERAFNI